MWLECMFCSAMLVLAAKSCIMISILFIFSEKMIVGCWFLIVVDCAKSKVSVLLLLLGWLVIVII